MNRCALDNDKMRQKIVQALSQGINRFEEQSKYANKLKAVKPSHCPNFEF